MSFNQHLLRGICRMRSEKEENRNFTSNTANGYGINRIAERCCAFTAQFRWKRKRERERERDRESKGTKERERERERDLSWESQSHRGHEARRLLYKRKRSTSNERIARALPDKMAGQYKLYVSLLNGYSCIVGVDPDCCNATVDPYCKLSSYMWMHIRILCSKYPWQSTKIQLFSLFSFT